MKALGTFAAACLVGCNGLLGLDEREHASDASVDSSVLADVGTVDAPSVDAPAVGDSSTTKPDSMTTDTVGDVARPDVSLTWCETEPPHTYCEDFDRGHVLGFFTTGTGKASLGTPAKTSPLALGCSIASSSSSSSGLLQIPVSKSSPAPAVAFDVMFDDVAAAAVGQVDVMQLLFLTTSFRLVYDKPAGMGASLKLTLDFGGGTTGSIGVGAVASGWNRLSFTIEGAGGSKKIVVRSNGEVRGSTGTGSLADSGGLFQIQRLTVGASAGMDGMVPLSVHFDDVTLDL